MTQVGGGRLRVATSGGAVLDDVDCLLWAIGRVPNVEIGLENVVGGRHVFGPMSGVSDIGHCPGARTSGEPTYLVRPSNKNVMFCVGWTRFKCPAVTCCTNTRGLAEARDITDRCSCWQGVELEKGHIKVDAGSNTTAPNIYALGDVCGKWLLTPGASRVTSCVTLTWRRSVVSSGKTASLRLVKSAEH